MKNLTEVKDHKGRPLLTTREVRGKLQVIMNRYSDMNDIDKRILSEVFKAIQEGGPVQDHLGKEILDIDDFVEFREKEDDLCG